jgi:hypothetical protein
MEHGVHWGATISFTVTQLCTGADLHVLMELPQGRPSCPNRASLGASSVAIENLIRGYDKASGGIASVVSLEDLMCCAP